MPFNVYSNAVSFCAVLYSESESERGKKVKKLKSLPLS